MNFFHITILVLAVVACNARPQAPQTRFFNFGGGNGPFGSGGFDFNNKQHLATAGAGLGTVAAGVFAAKNIFEGNGDISIAPVIGGAVNANGEFVPEISLATKVGNDPNINPTFNIGGQLHRDGIKPTFGGGVQVGNGPLAGNVNTGFVVGDNGQFTPKLGGGAAIGSISLGRPFGR